MTGGVLNVSGVAARWGVSETFVYEQIKAGRLQAFKLGSKLLRIKAEWVEEYEEQASGGERLPPDPALSRPISSEMANYVRLTRMSR